MDNAYKNFMEKLDQEGLLPTQLKVQPLETSLFSTAKENTADAVQNTNSGNIFTSKPFGMTVAPNFEPNVSAAPLSSDAVELINDSTLINGFDTDMFCESKFKKIDDKMLYMKLKIARLQAELEEHKKITEAAYLKSDKNHHQKLLQLQGKMEEQLKNLVADYQNQQLKSIVVSPFVKAFSYIKNYVALK